jgi:excisionase family DNA binding protein
MDYALLSAYLRVTERQLKRMVYERRIPYTKVGRFVRFIKRDIDEWLREHAVEATR